MNEMEPVLEFRNTSIAPAAAEHSGLGPFDASLPPGTLAVVRLEPGGEQSPLSEMAVGLLRPDAGGVLFLGESWAAMPPGRMLRRRAEIGRVFDGRGWLSNLTVAENVTLAARHHTRRPEADILAEAAALARSFGLAGLPTVRPDTAPGGELRRAEWARAFLGSPRLVLLERPMRGVPPQCLRLLVAAVRDACARGAAVLWLTDDDALDRNPDLPPGPRYAVRGETITTTNERQTDQRCVGRKGQ